MGAAYNNAAPVKIAAKTMTCEMVLICGVVVERSLNDKNNLRIAEDRTMKTFSFAMN